MNEGRRWKTKLWSGQGRADLEKLSLAPWASRRRKELLELLDLTEPTLLLLEMFGNPTQDLARRAGRACRERRAK